MAGRSTEVGSVGDAVVDDAAAEGRDAVEAGQGGGTERFDHRRGSRRRLGWITAGLVLVAAVVLLVVRPWDHPGGDPGGRVLSSLRATAATVLPSGTVVSWRRVHPAAWTDAGCDGMVGLIPVRVSISFDVPPGDDPTVVLAHAGSVLGEHGWTAQQAWPPGGGVGGSWRRGSGADTGRGALLALTQKDPAANPRWWMLDATAQPAGPLAATC